MVTAITTSNDRERQRTQDPPYQGEKLISAFHWKIAFAWPKLIRMFCEANLVSKFDGQFLAFWEQNTKLKKNTLVGTLLQTVEKIGKGTYFSVPR